MHDSTLLADIGKSVLGAAALGLPAYLLRLPLLLAYLLAGVVLGPHLGFGWVRSAESIATLSEIGLVLLMFILGLEIDLRKLLHAGKAVIVNGVTQFTLCAAMAAGFFWALGMGAESLTGRFGLLYLAVACSLSSTLVVVKVLSDRLELDTLPSRITLGILILQDLWAIAFLALQPDLARLGPESLLMSAGKVAVLVVASLGLARFALPPVFALAGKQPELMLIAALAWCFGICGIAAELHLSVEMGALVAGVVIASFPYHVDVAARLSSLRDFFITLFFVGLGLRIPRPTPEILGMAAAVVAFVSVSRIVAVFPVLHSLRYGNRSSLLPAVNLSQLSEFALVMTSLGVGYGHVRPELLSAFVIAMVAAALLSSWSIPAGHDIYRALNPWLTRLGFKDQVADVEGGDGAPAAETPPSLVLLGFFREASSLLHELQARLPEASLREILVVDFNPEAHRKLKKLGIRCKYGDVAHPDTLKSLGLESAAIVACTLPDHVLKGTTNLKMLRTLRKILPAGKGRVIVTAETLESAREMYRQGADYVFMPRMVTARYLADVLERLRREEANGMRAAAMEAMGKRVEILP